MCRASQVQGKVSVRTTGFLLPADISCHFFVSGGQGQLGGLFGGLDGLVELACLSVGCSQGVQHLGPFILSRQRNIKASAGLCVLIVGMFYVFIYICRYMGLLDFWAAFLPLLLFGPISVLMLDSVKT